MVALEEKAIRKTMPRWVYNPSRGGHAPGHLRDRFADEVQGEGEPMTDSDFERLIGQLWNCTDTMPSDLCDELDLPVGSTYAQGARSLRRRRR